MEFIGRVLAWIVDPASWTGSDGLGIHVWEQLVLSFLALVVAIAIALPLGLRIGHTGRGANAVIWTANIGRAVPSLGWIGIFFPIVLLLRTGSGGFWTSLIAFALLAIPPIVTNTYTGMREVDRDLIEAGRGMGMRERDVVTRVEIPLALPVILAGVRTSAAQTMATATLAVVVAGGTLGVPILQGIRGGDDVKLVGAALLVTLLTLATEFGFGALQRAATRRSNAAAGHRPFKNAGEVPLPPAGPM